MEKISIIVTSYNNSHNLGRCIKSLIDQKYDKNILDLEIIFVDSGSTDNSIDILNRYRGKIKTVLKPQKTLRLSPAMARNIGVENTNGNILIFTDSDCILPQTWTQNMVDCFKNSEIDCVIGSREPDLGKGFGTFIRRYDFILYSNKFRIPKPIIINEINLQKGVPFVLLSGNNFAIKKELWNRFGGMKSKVFKNPAGEDVMLEVDIIKNGYNVLFCPENKVTHIHSISLKKLFGKIFQRSEANYLLCKYSNGFISWRNFAERGHILNMNNFYIYIFLIISILLSTIFLKLSFYIITLSLFILFVLVSIIRLIRINHRLELILDSKDKSYKEDYNLPLYKLFYFDQIHSLMNCLASINFLWCFMQDKYDIIAKKINK